MTLPEGWVETTIADVATVNPKHDPDTDREQAVSFVPMPAVDEHLGAIIAPVDRTLDEIWKGFTHFAEGDVIFAKITPCMENGKAAIARGLTNGLACGSTEFYVLRPDADVQADYLWRYLRQRSYRSDAERHMTGAVGQRRVPRQYLEASPLPLPPAAEQHRIVAKLDALTARLARARAELDRVPVLAENLKRSTLVEAFNGALTAEWRVENRDLQTVQPRPHDELRAKFRSGEVRAEPYTIPDRWRWLRLPELGDLDRGKSRHRPRNDARLFDGQHPFVQTGDVRAAGQYLTNFTETYSDFGLAQSRKWPQGTVCITIAANIAETAVLGISACFPDSVVGFSADNDKAVPEYVEYFIRTAKADLERFAPATAQKNINLDTLAALAVPTPPVAEQRAILGRIEAAFARAERMEAEAARARALIDRLEAAILAKAFRGELVPQDPNDEPASVLLDRIRAQRAAAPKPKRGRRKKASE